MKINPKSASVSCALSFCPENFQFLARFKKLKGLDALNESHFFLEENGFKYKKNICILQSIAI
jgi:hypothetical protein